MLIRNQHEITEQMNKVAEYIELFNNDEIELSDDELDQLEAQRAELLLSYYRKNYPENVIPII